MPGFENMHQQGGAALSEEAKEKARKLAIMARPAEKRAETKRLTSDAMVEIGKDRLVENFTRKRNLQTPEQQDFQNN
jgi:hypothetical protein